MPSSPYSQLAANFLSVTAPVVKFLTQSKWAGRVGEAGISDFVVGNPQEMPLAGFVDALQKHVKPQNRAWFGYKNNEPESQRIVASSLREWRGAAFEPDDVFMTNGAFAALSVALCALIDPGDEVIFISPPWFFYEALIIAARGIPVRVKIITSTFDLDLEAIAAAITPKTRAIIVNSPNNPTGKIYPASTLEALGKLLASASVENARTVYLISDEAYSRIVYDARVYPSPTSYYANSLLLYTYGKTLLTPGQRLGYIALPPEMPDREALRPAIFAAQVMTGFAFPNALLQHALADLELLSIDIEHLQLKRDRMVALLRGAGYELHVPEGTFYLLPRSPIADDLAFIDLLADQNVFCLPGAVVEMPGFFRVSITASDQMIEQSEAGFVSAMAAAHRR